MSLALSNTFQVYTHRNADNIKVSLNEERKFLTNSERRFSTYVAHFDQYIDQDEFNFQNYVEKQVIEGMTYLDSGAGEGRTIESFLEMYSKYSAQIKCDGISLHLFKNVKSVLKKFPRKITWFHGDALKILKNMPSQSYDLITDVFGAYFYSADHYEILQEYHRVLKPSGRCYLTEKFKINQGAIGTAPLKQFNLEKYLCEKAPASFKLMDRAFIISKVSLRFPIGSNLILISSDSVFMVERNKRRYKTMTDGCGVTQDKVRYEERPCKRACLRQFPIEKDSISG